jgi:hypothetical protein
MVRKLEVAALPRPGSGIVREACFLPAILVRTQGQSRWKIRQRLKKLRNFLAQFFALPTFSKMVGIPEREWNREKNQPVEC